MRYSPLYVFETVYQMYGYHIIGHSSKHPSLKRYKVVVPASTTAITTVLFPSFRKIKGFPFRGTEYRNIRLIAVLSTLSKVAKRFLVPLTAAFEPSGCFILGKVLYKEDRSSRVGTGVVLALKITIKNLSKVKLKCSLNYD
jgi:hypothetical protein